MSEAWRDARLSVLTRFVSLAADHDQEMEALSRIAAEDELALLEGIFEASRKAGLMIAERLGRPATLEEILPLLAASRIPCFQTTWSKESAALSRYSYKSACPRFPLRLRCDYSRTAAKGFLLGVNPDAAFSRHRSLGHGNEGCLDYVFLTPMVHRQLGPVPTPLRRHLHSVICHLADEGIELRLNGFCENELYVNIEGLNTPLSDSDREGVVMRVLSSIHPDFPEVRVVDKSRRTILEGTVRVDPSEETPEGVRFSKPPSEANSDAPA